MQKPPKYVVEQKNSRILLFPGQQAPPKITQSKIISFIQAQSDLQKKLNIPFFMSLNALEPQISPQTSLSYELMEILIQSYQMIITELGDSFEGLQLYFQNKINQLLRLPSAQKILDERKKSQKQDNQKINEELYQMLDSVSKSRRQSIVIDSSDITQLSASQITQLYEKTQEQQKEVQVIEEDEETEKAVINRPGRQNSLINYLNMQQRLVQEEERAKKILEDYDNTKKQIETARENQLAEQSSSIENRLRKRNQKQLSGNSSQCKLAEIKEQDETKIIDDQT